MPYDYFFFNSGCFTEQISNCHLHFLINFLQVFVAFSFEIFKKNMILGPIFMVCALKPRFSEIFQIYQKAT